MTVNGRTLEPVAQAYADLKGLEQALAYGVYTITVNEPAKEDSNESGTE